VSWVGGNEKKLRGKREVARPNWGEKKNGTRLEPGQRGIPQRTMDSEGNGAQLSGGKYPMKGGVVLTVQRPILCGGGRIKTGRKKLFENTA